MTIVVSFKRKRRLIIRRLGVVDIPFSYSVPSDAWVRIPTETIKDSDFDQNMNTMEYL